MDIPDTPSTNKDPKRLFKPETETDDCTVLTLSYGPVTNA